MYSEIMMPAQDLSFSPFTSTGVQTSTEISNSHPGKSENLTAFANAALLSWMYSNGNIDN